MQKFVLIHNWHIIATVPDAYTPPEQIVYILQGNIYGHPYHIEGKYVRTSRIISAKGRIIQTKNTTYKLGRIDEDYRKWLKKNKPEWDYRNPIKTKQGKLDDGSLTINRSYS